MFVLLDGSPSDDFATRKLKETESFINESL